jgi:signal transduction histidine kinase
MLDPAGESSNRTLLRFRELEKSMEARLAELSGILGTDEAPAINELRSRLRQYFEFLYSVPAAGERGFPAGTAEIRRQLRERREAIVTMTKDVAEIDQRRFARGNAAVGEARSGLSAYLWRMTGIALALGAIITVMVGHKIRALQVRDQVNQERMARSEAELRRLSAEVVREHEEERKALSRELHDEVGQTLTALGIEIAKIERLMRDDGPEFKARCEDARQLVQQTLRTVRNMAMGLRPSMLDDSGLVPALRWQVNEFSKRAGVPVDLQIDGAVDKLDEGINTCIYRVVQEALTNCARHAKAQHIRVAVHGKATSVSLAIQDDGVGFQHTREKSGLGIIGIEERVRDLGGHFRIQSERQRGTLLLAEIPLGAHT